MILAPRPFSRLNLRRGSALLATLAVIAALALVVALVSRVLREDQRYIKVRQERLNALAWAEAGVAIASHPLIKRGDPTLIWAGPDGEGYKVTIESEDARINPAVVLQREDDIFLESLFALWGMDPDSSAVLIDSMRDWIDDDDSVGLNGAEEGEYEGSGMPGVPPNRRFLSVEEIRHVRGAQALDMLRPGWESLFTVRGSGVLDLKDAPAELIAAACGVPIETAQRFVELRRGPDGIPDNDDDPPMTSLSDALTLLGPPGVSEEILNSRVGVGSSTQRITSIGSFGKTSRTLAAVILKGNARPAMLWRGEVPSVLPDAPNPGG
ncbi:MAG: general secretion pathway protein GspK [Verrucomicrobiales bacterium]